MAKNAPKLGELIDELYALRAQRLETAREFEKQIEEMKKDETDLRSKIIKALRAQKLDKGSGADCTATITTGILPRVTDWDKVYEWVAKTKAFEIFERRISKSAFKERYEAGDPIPGVDAFEYEDLSLTKR